jgi:ubiquinone/menaquinone biosynthesis C-methylase UbiE
MLNTNNNQDNFSQSGVVDLFSEKYKTAGKFGNFLIDNFYNSINSLIDQIPNKESLSWVHEVACGPGESTKRIFDYLNKVSKKTASDFEIDLVNFAEKENPSIKFYQESIYKIEAKEKEVDLIFALEVLEHLENPEKAIKEMARVSKYAIISTPNEPLWRAMNVARLKYVSDLGNTPGHLNHWSPFGLYPNLYQLTHSTDIPNNLNFQIMF